MTLPFYASPGLDPDAWRVLLAARHIAEHHTYTASRLPGYPVPELVLSLFASSPAWVPVLVTFLVSFGGFVAFSKVVESAGIKNRLLPTLAFALTPVAVINCFTTMDYMWAISFALLSFLLVARKQSLVAGLFLGVAVGCRITTILMIIPFSHFIWSSNESERMRVKESLLFVLSALIVGMVCYGPVISTYGFSFLHHSTGGPLHFINLVKTISADTFGVVGTVAIFSALVVQVSAKHRRDVTGSPDRRTWARTCWFVVVLYGALFLWLPLEAGYLIPLLPFLLLLAWFHLSHASLKILAYGLIISSFLVSVDTKDRPWSAPSSPVSVKVGYGGRSLAVDFIYGPLPLDFLKRQSQLVYADSVLAWARAKRDSAILVAGVWLPQLSYRANKPASQEGEKEFRLEAATLVGLLNTDRATACLRAGLPVYYLPGQDGYEKEVYGIELKKYGGRELELYRAVQ